MFKLKFLTVTVSTFMLAACGQMPSQQMRMGEVTALSMPAPALKTTAYEHAQLLAENTENYQKIETNPVHSVAQQPISTFSIDVDTGSYSNVRRFLLQNGQLPPVDAVRIEEMVNYFNYDYPNPTAKSQHPFSVNTETVDSPWQPNAKIIRIGIKAKDLQAQQLPPANLVFLIDVSGSMDAENKLPLVKKTLRLLTEQLRPQDQV